METPENAKNISTSNTSSSDPVAVQDSSVADEFRKSNTQVSRELVPSTEKERDDKSSIQEPVGSPSRYVDAYFADHLNVDCADSTHSANLSLKQSRDAPQSPNALMESKEPVLELEINHDIRKDVEMPTGASATALEQAEEDRQGKSSFDVKPVETDGKQGSGDIPSSLCPKVEYLSVDKNLDKQRYEHSVTKVTADIKKEILPFSFGKKNRLGYTNCSYNRSQDFKMQNAGAGCKVDLKSTSQVLPESLQIVPENKDCGKTTEAISSEHVEDMMLNDPKAIQHRRGMHRRCLQFEETQQKIIADTPGYWNRSNSVTSSRSSASFADSEVLESSFEDIPASPSNRQLTNMIHSRNDENSSLKVSRPSGIGLHLNSIVTAMPVGFCATASTKPAYRSYFNVQATNDDSIAASSAPCSFTSSGKRLNNTLLLKSIEHQATPCDKKRSYSELANGLELNQLSPKKKRKKTSGTSDGDGCERCNCKKTNCLKLYCDCFAAGIYCAEPCACQACFNRPEYEDTVIEEREKIESRNPLAFAPKIIQHAPEPPTNTFGENENRLTPTSARHKIGCNCRKSMCLKKYCECYQANVGCSARCRCEGCENVYGRKEVIHNSSLGRENL